MAENTNKSVFTDKVVSVRRVTKVTKGGKRFTFSAVVVSGRSSDKPGLGLVGIGLGKSREVSSAIAKATARARKNLIEVAIRGTTLPYDVRGRHGATSVLLRSAYQGTGVIAGGAVAAVMQALGIKDVLTKTLGPSRSGPNVVKATLNALAQCRSVHRIARLRGKTVAAITKGTEHAGEAQ
jgi:small subunit ribosomal protein S5